MHASTERTKSIRNEVGQENKMRIRSSKVLRERPQWPVGCVWREPHGFLLIRIKLASDRKSQLPL